MLLLGHDYNVGVPTHLQKIFQRVVYEGQYFMRVKIDILHLGQLYDRPLLRRRLNYRIYGRFEVWRFQVTLQDRDFQFD